MVDGTSDSPLILKYGDGKADGKKSIAGTGKMIRFTAEFLTEASKPEGSLCSLRLSKSPDEDARFTIVSEDGQTVIHTELVPYATFKRGESQWTTIRFREEVGVPETFGSSWN
ncbi:MAG: hypothetical protein R3C19_01400 [Planctomycetaceae bacterium]